MITMIASHLRRALIGWKIALLAQREVAAPSGATIVPIGFNRPDG